MPINLKKHNGKVVVIENTGGYYSQGVVVGQQVYSFTSNNIKIDDKGVIIYTPTIRNSDSIVNVHESRNPEGNLKKLLTAIKNGHNKIKLEVSITTT